MILRVAGGLANWVFRFTAPIGKRREMGLGSVERSSAATAGKSLAGAREAAYKARALLLQGVDPIDDRDQQRRAARQAAEARKVEANADELTLARVARAYHERVIEPARTAKHAAQWIASLERNVLDAIWHKPIDKVEAPELLDCVADLQARIPETASRVRQRLEAVFDHAEFLRLCTGNPARAIRRKLTEARGRRDRGAFTALPFKDALAFLRELRLREGIAACALEFAMLTAARTGEVIGATWNEFDLDAAVWSVKAARMKGGEKHVVYLPERAVEIVRSMQPWQQPYVFPAPTLNGQPLSNMSMLTLLRRMDADKHTTVHGLCRSTFSTWANETAAARPYVIEACLAHQETNRVRAAYNRAQFAQERKALLAAWADYLEGKATVNNVVSLVPLCVA